MNINALQIELEKPDYFGLSSTEVVAKFSELNPSISKVGRIEGDNKLDLLTFVVETDLDDRLTKAAHVELTESATAMEVTRKSLANKLRKVLNPEIIMKSIFRINFAVPKVRDMWDGALAVGLINEEEYNEPLTLATYTVGGEVITEEQVEKALLSRSPTTIEASYPSLGFILNKYRQKITVSVDIISPLPFSDVITFVGHSGDVRVENDVPITDYALDQRQRAVIHVPANFTGKLSTAFDYTNLLTKVKAFGSSRYKRNFTASITNSVG